MIWTAAFALFFVGGPVLFGQLTRAQATPAVLRRLAVLTLAMGGLGVLAGTVLPALTGPQTWAALGTILLLWLGWVSLLALITQVLRSRNHSGRMRRWSGVMGAICTTVPWFGLAAANIAWNP